jgi:hypothetical protein
MTAVCPKNRNSLSYCYHSACNIKYLYLNESNIKNKSQLRILKEGTTTYPRQLIISDPTTQNYSFAY